MSARIICEVSGCHRGMAVATAVKRWGHSHVSIICAKCWRRLTKAERQVWARIRRFERRWGESGARGQRIWSALARRSAAPA